MHVQKIEFSGADSAVLAESLSLSDSARHAYAVFVYCFV